MKEHLKKDVRKRNDSLSSSLDTAGKSTKIHKKVPEL